MPVKDRVFWDAEWRCYPQRPANSYAHMIIPTNDIAGKRVLEVGCGDLIYSNVTDAKNVVGLDISMNALRRAAEYIPSPPLVVTMGDAIRLPFRSNFFDTSIAIDTLALLGRQYYKALEEMCRVTRDVVIFTMIHQDNLTHQLYCSRNCTTDFTIKETDRDLGVIVDSPFKCPGMGDEVYHMEQTYLDEEILTSVLDRLSLTPHSITVLTGNEMNNVGVPFYRRCLDPDDDYKSQVFVRALKRK